MSITSSPLNEGDEPRRPNEPAPLRVSDMFPSTATGRLEGLGRGSMDAEQAGHSEDAPATLEPAAADGTEAGARSLSADTGPDDPAPPSMNDATSTEANRLDEADVARTAEQPQLDTAVEMTPVAPALADWLPPNSMTAEAEAAAPTTPDPAIPHVAAGPDLLEPAAGAARESIEGSPAVDPAPAGSPAAEMPQSESDRSDDPASLDPFKQTADGAEPGPETTGAPPPPLFPLESREGGRSLASALDTVPAVEFAPNLASNYPQPMRATGGLTSANPQQLASAFGATAKLAADATAAAEALENLKRLLERQLPNPAQASSRQVVRERLAQTAISQDPPPLPREEGTRESLQPEVPDYKPAGVAQKPPVRPRTRTTGARERRQFDFRGFMAGFALSWAIGAVLYIYLTAG
jgi:hypothetical protein